MREEFTATAIARLYLICNKHRTRCIARLTCRKHKFICCNLNTANALNRLDDNGGVPLREKLTLEGLQVVQIDESYIIGLIRRGLNSRVIRQRYGHTRAAVKGGVHSQNARAARSE